MKHLRILAPNAFAQLEMADGAQLRINAGKFTFGPAGSEMKQFAFKLDEAMTYANFQPDYAAIVRAEIPTSLLGNFNVSNAIDPFIFKSGVLTLNGQSGLNYFNSIVKNIGHAY